MQNFFNFLLEALPKERNEILAKIKRAALNRASIFEMEMCIFFIYIHIHLEILFSENKGA
jgi:hypothetical protein